MRPRLVANNGKKKPLFFFHEESKWEMNEESDQDDNRNRLQKYRNMIRKFEAPGTEELQLLQHPEETQFGANLWGTTSTVCLLQERPRRSVVRRVKYKHFGKQRRDDE